MPRALPDASYQILSGFPKVCEKSYLKPFGKLSRVSGNSSDVASGVASPVPPPPACSPSAAPASLPPSPRLLTPLSTTAGAAPAPGSASEAVALVANPGIIDEHADITKAIIEIPAASKALFACFRHGLLPFRFSWTLLTTSALFSGVKISSLSFAGFLSPLDDSILLIAAKSTPSLFAYSGSSCANLRTDSAVACFSSSNVIRSGLLKSASPPAAASAKSTTISGLSSLSLASCSACAAFTFSGSGLIKSMSSKFAIPNHLPSFSSSHSFPIIVRVTKRNFRRIDNRSRRASFARSSARGSLPIVVILPRNPTPSTTPGSFPDNSAISFCSFAISAFACSA